MFNKGPRFGNANEAGGPSSSDTDTAHDPLVWPPPSRPPPTSPARSAAGRRRSHATSRARSVSAAARGGNAAPRSRRSLSAQGRPEEGRSGSGVGAGGGEGDGRRGCGSGVGEEAGLRQLRVSSGAPSVSLMGLCSSRSPPGMARQGTPAAGSEAGAEAQGPAAARTPYGPDQALAEMLERDIVVKGPNVKWEDIAGLEKVKTLFMLALVVPKIMPKFFTGIRKPIKGMLLFGPPGTGKTMLAKAAATETGYTFFNVSAATLASKYRGEAPDPAVLAKVRLLFDVAREKAPSIIFIDEVDSLCSQRGGPGEQEASRRVKAELLTQIDGLHGAKHGGQKSKAKDTDQDADADADAGGGEAEPRAPNLGLKHVFVLAATNFLWDLDEAMRRRLEKRVYIPLPDPAQRLQLLQLNLKGVDVAADVDLEVVAEQLDGYSGDDITNVCHAAAMSDLSSTVAGKSEAEILAMHLANSQMGKEPVTAEVFGQAIANINPSVGQEAIKRHEEWKKVFGSV